MKISPIKFTTVKQNFEGIHDIGEIIENKSYNDGFLNHTTSFFRYEPEEHTDLFLISLLKNKKSSKPLNIISAGCSFGEEAYSYALGLDNLPIKPNIVGIDMSQKVIKEAKKGKYILNMSEYDFLVVPSIYRKNNTNTQEIRDTFKRNFSQPDKRRHLFALKKNHLKNVKFICADIQNIEKYFKQGSQDLILCRFVLYHFNAQESKENLEKTNAVLKQFYKILKPGGMLCLNKKEFENYNKTLKQIGFIKPFDKKPWIYQKPKNPLTRIQNHLKNHLFSKSDFKNV